jgi:hypothetical protein
MNGNNSMFNNLTISGYAMGANPNNTPMVFNVAPVNQQVAYFAGSLSLGGLAAISLQNNMTVFGGLTGSGALQLWSSVGNTSTLALAGSSNYTGSKVTVQQGILSLLNGGTSTQPLGTAAVTVNPGGILRLAANNLGGALTLNSDSGNLAVLGLAYNPGSAAIPGTFNANPVSAAAGIASFKENLDEQGAAALLVAG